MNAPGVIWDRATTADVLRLANCAPPNAKGLLSCPLPGHDDPNPSFKVVGASGWTCFGCGRSGGISDLIVTLGLASTRADAATWLEEKLGRSGWPRRKRNQTIAVYDYADEKGDALYQVERQVGPDGKKTFRQRRPLGSGQFLYSLGDVRRVPYALPSVRKAIEAGRTIVVVEGEKDVDSLAKIGIVATTSAGGSAFAWTAAFIEPLRGAKRFVVIADSDEPGRRAARQRADALRAICDDVKVVDLGPDRTDGYDVSDWLAAGGMKPDLVKILHSAPQHVPTEEPPPAPITAIVDHGSEKRSLPDLDFRLVRGGVISARGFVPPAWEIAPLLLKTGGPALVTAAPERFKSWFGMEVCVALATGRRLFGEFEPAERRPFCIYLDLDAGADETENKLAMFCDLPDNLMVASWEATEFSFDALDALLARYPGAFVVIDCLSSVYCPEPSQDINRAIRLFLVQLRSIYRKHGANGLLIDHDARLKRDASESYSGPAQKKAAIRQGITLDFAPEAPTVAGIAPPAGTVVRFSALKMSAAASFKPFDVRFSFPDGSRFESTYLGTIEDVATKQNALDAIVAIVRASTAPISGRAIARRADLPRSRAEGAIERAVQLGLIAHNGLKTNKAGYIAAQPPEPTHENMADNLADDEPSW